MKLVIAEKPSVAKTIANVIGATKHNDGYLSGGGYAVSWCFGHLAELAQAESYNESYGKWKYSDLPIIPDAWQYAVSEDKRKQFEIISNLMHDESITEVINACDAGREGELIFRTVFNLAGCSKTMKRLWISSMEDKALIDFVATTYKGKHSILQVGTGDSPLTIPFYEKCGFIRSHSIKNFFTDNYDHPIYEAGTQLVDMIYLQKKI